LHAIVDDATSRIQELRFAPTETSETYFKVMEAYIEKYGLPLGTYSDRHGVFHVNAKEAESGTGETQFGRAMRELGIEVICANSAQARGRVERANRTLQDRLVKEMRLAGISDIPAATAFLPHFIEDYNQKSSPIQNEPEER
jgi:sulfur relay (sulfurtransferase) complex TusBCD TusD component (DsrE family)